MTDYQGAFEKVLYDRLRSQVTLGNVFQHVPDGVAPPLTIISDIDFENQGGKDGPLLRFTAVLTSIIAGRSRKPLTALQAQVFGALDQWQPTATSAVQFGQVMIDAGTGQEVTSDGGTVYFGQQTATCFVQAAD